MSTPGKVHPNTRTRSSAAAFSGVIGVPDPGRNSTPGDGALRDWCRHDFLPAFDRLTERRPELRSFNRQERYFARIIG
jgi:hypothetical protein